MTIYASWMSGFAAGAVLVAIKRGDAGQAVLCALLGVGCLAIAIWWNSNKEPARG